jgi:hypothetical protein
VALNRYMMPLADDTELSGASTRLEAPQSKAQSEEQIVMIGLSPRLEGHVTRRYVGCAGVVLEFVN